ncbi:WYL domain-containing transcriptional regulator [Sphingomonas sp. YL-JM2C]
MSFGKAVDLLRLAMMSTGRVGVCLTDIESEFNCVRRTAQRMVAALQEVFPATEHHIGDDGRHYWTLPARAIASLLSPSADELAALTSAIAELDRVGMGPEATQLRQLDHKVRALVPPERGARLAVDEEALLEAMGFAARPGPRATTTSEVDEAISQSLKGPFHLEIDYRSRADAGAQKRTIAPYGLLLGARRYVVGTDIAKKDGRIRHYRVEDITTARTLDSSFPYPSEFNLTSYAQRAFGSFHNEDEYGEIIWRFRPDAAGQAQRFLFHPTQTSDIEEDGSLVVRFNASGHVEMAWHLYSWGDAVEVIEPAALAALVHPYRRADFPALP